MHRSDSNYRPTIPACIAVVSTVSRRDYGLSMQEEVSMIISVSRRTDISAFYSDWLLNRLQEGFALVRNPFNPHQVSRVSLDARVVDCLVFWTKKSGSAVAPA